MKPDDELCLCFHVTKRKVVNYIRIEKPKRVAQLSDCYGAGTGCGWCRPFLRRLFEEAQSGQASSDELPTMDEYADGRSAYVESGKGTPPPGATPVKPAIRPNDPDTEDSEDRSSRPGGHGSDPLQE